MFNRMMRFLIAALCMAVVPLSANLEVTESEVPSVAVKVSLVNKELVIGEAFWVALEFQVEEPWHLYWRNPGDVGLAPRLEWSLPQGIAVEEVLWQAPERFISDGLVGFGYGKPFTLLARLSASSPVTIGDEIHVGLAIHWLSCSEEMCLPGMASDSFVLKAQERLLFTNEQTSSTRVDDLMPKRFRESSLSQNGDLLFLTGRREEGKTTPLRAADFFPEKGVAVDYRAATELISSEGDKVVLQLLADGDLLSPFRGIVILKGEEGTEAYTVDLPGPITHSEVASLTLSPTEQQPYGEGESLLWAISLAFLGGICLNMMPCVLPVISLKVLSFVKMAGEKRAKTLRHGLAFCIGVLLSFWALAGMLLILQAYGNSVGWGFQLQEPLFVAALSAFLFLFALSLFGIFEVGTLFASWVGTRQGPPREGLFSSFSNGVLATAVATPCTGPFLGSAIGLAVTLPPLQALSIFTSLGCGMAAPYMFFAAFPSSLRFLPRPGHWMELFKQFLGFVMLATVLWLTWVFGTQQGVTPLCLLLGALFVLAFAIWIYAKTTSPTSSRWLRLTGTICALAAAAFSCKTLFDAAVMPSETTEIAAEGNEWEPFNPSRIAELQKRGIPLFIDFTAKWCLICQTNHLVLESDSVRETMKAQGIVKMKADWTKGDPTIAEWLRRYGRSGVPLYVYFDPTGKSEVLPQLLTPQTVIQAIQQR